MTDREDILEKIRKCMSLAQSATEHEAAAALRQAQKLMAMHQVSQAEMLAAGVREARAKSSAARTPPKWEAELAYFIATAFGCKLIFESAWGMSPEGRWKFIGLDPAEEIATYSFDVLLRQAQKARRDYIASELTRIKKRRNKTRRADLYSEGWVHSACAHVAAPTRSDDAVAAIDAYMQINHPNLQTLSAKDRNAGRRLSEKDHDAFAVGHRAGQGARLRQGVGASIQKLLEGAR